MGIVPGILTALGLNKWLAYLIEIAAAAALVIFATLYVVHLHNKAEAFDALSAEHRAIERKYGCDQRPSVSERELQSCLIARDLDASKALAAEIDRQATAAAHAQAKLDADNAAAGKQQQTTDTLIDQDARTGDGAVPNVLLDSWDRERKAMGLK